MRHLVMTLVLGLSITLPAAHVCAKPLIPGAEAVDESKPVDNLHSVWATTAFSLSAGYRIDKLSWNIAGNRQGSNPNILSELTWSDIAIYQLKVSNQTVIKDRVYIRSHLDYGMVATGDNRDSDYNGDNRTQEFSRSINGVDGNRVWDGSIGVGPRFSFFNATFIVCPMLGYGFSEQDFNIVDGYQTLAQPPSTVPIGPIAGLDSRYQTSWQGPWIGVDLMFSIPLTEGPFSTVGVMFSGEYHWVEYEADANWNLRTDFRHPVSFSHDASGNGVALGATIFFETKSRWRFNAGMNTKEMVTNAGSDRIYYADGTIVDTQLNEVSWQVFIFDAGLSYQF